MSILGDKPVEIAENLYWFDRRKPDQPAAPIRPLPPRRVAIDIVMERIVELDWKEKTG